MEETGVVVSQEDAQYIIERQRRELNHLRACFTHLCKELAYHVHGQLTSEAAEEYLDSEALIQIRKHCEAISAWCEKTLNARD